MGGCCSGQREKDKDKGNTLSDTKDQTKFSRKRHLTIEEVPETAGLPEEILLVPLFSFGDKHSRSNSANNEARWDRLKPWIKDISENESSSPKNFSFSFGRADTEERRDLSRNMEEDEEESKLWGDQRDVSEEEGIEDVGEIFIFEATKVHELAEVHGEGGNEIDIKDVDRNDYVRIFKRNEYIESCEKQNLEEDQDKHEIKSDSEEISKHIEAKTSEHDGVEGINIKYHEENYSHIDSKEIYGEADMKSGEVEEKEEQHYEKGCEEDNDRIYTRYINREKVITTSKIDEISLFYSEKSEKDNMRRIDPKESFILVDINSSEGLNEIENLAKNLYEKLPENHDGKTGREEINEEGIKTSEIEENNKSLIEKTQEENKSKIYQVHECKAKETNTNPDKIEESKQYSEKIQGEDERRAEHKEIHEIVTVEPGEIECDISENEYYDIFVKLNCKLIEDIIKNQKEDKSSLELIEDNKNLREDKDQDIKENNKDSMITGKKERISESNENRNEALTREKEDQQSIDNLSLPLENESEFSNIDSRNAPILPFKVPVNSHDPGLPDFLNLSVEDEFQNSNKIFRNRSLAVYSNTPMNPLLFESNNINPIAEDKEIGDFQEIPRNFVRRHAISLKEMLVLATPKDPSILLQSQSFNK